MDAAAWGGQIAAEEKVALRALEAMAKVSYSFFHKDEVNSADPGHFRNEISLCLPPKSPFRNEILANVAEDACLPPEEETARASLARQGSSGLHFSLKQFSLPRDTSVKREKPSAALWELPDDPDDRLIDHSNPTTLVCQKLGRFKFKGSDEIHDMVNLTPASLLARQYPPDAPTGKGERVSCQPPLCSEILRVDIPSMHFVQEMREQCATDIAKARFARPDVVLRVTSMNDREKSCETPKAAKLNLFSRITTLGRSVPTDINESLEKNEAKQVDLPRKSLFTRLTTLGRSEEMMNERGSSNGLKSIRSHGHGQKSISSNYYT